METIHWVLVGVAATIAIGCATWLVLYFGRPHCYTCGQRTKGYRDGPDEELRCWGCLLQRRCDFELKVRCPAHGEWMTKEIHNGLYVIDRCLEGCVFLGPEELDRIEQDAEATGRSSGTAVGVAIGVAAGG